MSVTSTIVHHPVVNTIRNIKLRVSLRRRVRGIACSLCGSWACYNACTKLCR